MKDHQKKICYGTINSLILFTLLFISMPFSLQPVLAKPKPRIWHDYEYFDLSLSKGYCANYSRHCLAVSVHVTYLYPDGGKVDVTIYVQNKLKWSGQLYEGDSSPTISANNKYTVVHIAHPNGDPPLEVEGYIDWVMN